MFKNRYFLLVLTISLLFIQGSFWLIFTKLNLLPPQLPIFYFEKETVNQLASPFSLWLFIVLPLAVLIVNTAIADLAYSKERLIAQLFMTVTLIVSFLDFFSLWLILRRVGLY